MLDEVPGAYKHLGSVIAAQTDLVQVEARLTTLLCVEGWSGAPLHRGRCNAKG